MNYSIYNKQRFLFMLLSLLVLIPFFAIASTPIVGPDKYGVSLSSGHGSAEITPIRIGIQKYWKQEWLRSCPWSFRGYWEASLYYMNGRHGSMEASNSNLQALALAGVLRYESNAPILHLWPFFDVGIGASYLSKSSIGDRRLGIHYQFEDRLGVGVRFGHNKQYELGYRFIHFSNAFMAWYNHGINLHTIVLGYWF